MIGFLRGRLDSIGLDSILLDVHGVGYRLYISSGTVSSLPPVGSEVKLYTYLQIREDAACLYGFQTPEELEMFEQLISVSGIGPKGALGVFGVMSVSDLKFAILSDDDKSIARSPGIGPKTARRIVMELKEKVSLADAFEERISADTQTAADAGVENDAVAGLVALGYGASESLRAVRAVSDRTGLDAGGLIKAALKHLLS